MRIPVGVLGATGIVGQNYLLHLHNHPLFKVEFLAASQHSSGESYGKAVEGRWQQREALPEAIASLPLHSIEEIEYAQKSCRLVFSAVSSAVAQVYEERYALAGLAVVSNASYHRRTEDIPLLIPEINPEHLSLIPIQQKKRGWKRGFIVVKPNCSLQSYLLPLFPLHKRFKMERVMVTMLQAISGAGISHLSAFSLTDNVIPFIEGEEEKSEVEPLKILGELREGYIAPAKEIAFSAHCNRVPVLDGHLACVSVSFQVKPTPEEILAAWQEFKGAPQELDLPLAPKQPIIYCDKKDRPQPRLDRLRDKAMAVTTGRLRSCPIFDYRFVALSHNTIRGAAGGAILSAELLAAQGFLND